MDPTTLLRLCGVALVAAGGLGVIVIVIADRDGLVRRAAARYVDRLEREVRFLRLPTRGAHIAAAQLASVLIVSAAALLLDEPLLFASAPILAAAPAIVLRRRHAERVARIEAQLDGWLSILANALRASPSLGEAIRSSAQLVDGPIAEELDVTIKEMRLGAPVDRAVLDLGARVSSRTLSGALAAVLVGRQTGGQLSDILDSTAASIREMTRLEGVLRAKTAEGRSQAYVLGAIPFFLIAAIQLVDPHWLEPLSETPIGMAVTAVSFTLWLVAILLARRILAVDL